MIGKHFLTACGLPFCSLNCPLKTKNFNFGKVQHINFFIDYSLGILFKTSLSTLKSHKDFIL